MSRSPTKKLTIAALLAVTGSVAGCNSTKASSTDSGTAATTAAASGGCALTAAQVTTVALAKLVIAGLH